MDRKQGIEPQVSGIDTNKNLKLIKYLSANIILIWLTYDNYI